MNTNYEDEATKYPATDDEATQYEDNSTQIEDCHDNTSADEIETTTEKSNDWKRAAVGAGSGLLIGSVSTVLMGMKSADSNPDIEKPQEDSQASNHKEVLSHPEWVDDDMRVATNVNDDMSFGEAFAAARSEVGAGGCFEWHGNVYGTYTAEEWNNMTEEQRAEYGNHFNWNHIDNTSSGNVAHHSAADKHTTQSRTSDSNEDDIEVVSVNHENNTNTINTQEVETISVHATQGDIVSSAGNDSEIEILGVVHNNENGANIGGMIVDGQEVILIDVDGDMEFDYMASDLNGNEDIDKNEWVNIQGQGYTVNSLGGFINPTDNNLGSNNSSDYSSDIYEN